MTPGRYDALAAAMSTAAQLLGVAGLALVPAGALWLLKPCRGPAGAGAGLVSRDGNGRAALAIVSVRLAMRHSPSRVPCAPGRGYLRRYSVRVKGTH